MNSKESLVFIRGYFEELFGKRNLGALDKYLADNYFDDDIGLESNDHIQNSKQFLARLFKSKPTIGVYVSEAQIKDNVITAYLEWFEEKENKRIILQKGIGIFVIDNGKILKRHTYLYDVRGTFGE